MLEGCIMEGLFTATNRATERVLQANGYATADAPSQGCCGALSFHAGREDEEKASGRRRSGLGFHVCFPVRSRREEVAAGVADPAPASMRLATTARIHSHASLVR